MLQKSTLTYGQLHQKLKEIGYKQCVVQVDGKDGIAFEHEKVRGALILLPKRDADAIVEQPYLQSVLVMLRLRGLIDAPDPLAMLQ